MKISQKVNLLNQNFKNYDSIIRGAGGKNLLSSSGVTESEVNARGAEPLWKLRAKRVNLILILFFILSSNCLAHISILEFADYLYDAEKYIPAITEYKRYHYYFPECNESEVYYKIGLSYFKLGDYEKSREYFYKIIDEMPDSPFNVKAWRGNVKSYILSGEYRLAHIELAYAKEEMDSDEIKYLRGINYLYQKRWKEARTEFSYILNKNLKDYIFISKVKGLNDCAIKAEKLPYKSKTSANLLSLIIPGSGQIYCGKYFNGVSAFILNASFTYLTIRLLLDKHYISGIILGCYEYSLWHNNRFNACNFADEYNENIANRFILPILKKEW